MKDTEDLDVEEPLHTLDDLHEKLEDIEKAILSQGKNSPSSPRSIEPWLIVLFLILLIRYGPPMLWHSKIRYALQYQVGYHKVMMDPEPVDCDFLRAPIGFKGCHYAREVNAVTAWSNQWGGQSISYDGGKTWIQTATSRGGYPVVSRDDGKTWSTEDVPPNMESQVIVSWRKQDGND